MLAVSWENKEKGFAEDLLIAKRSQINVLFTQRDLSRAVHSSHKRAPDRVPGWVKWSQVDGFKRLSM